jgi:hypothetical protein
MDEPTFCHKLTALLNEYSMENGSDTPDYILAQYLVNCLAAYNIAVQARDRWHSFEPFREIRDAKTRVDGEGEG